MPTMPILRGAERAGQIMDRFLSQRFAELSLTDAEVHVLMHLSDPGRASVAQVQRAFGLRPSTLTSILDRLEGRGYLTRELNPENRRSLVVVLTPDGQIMAETVVGLLREIEDAIRAQVQQGDVEGFLAVVEAIARLAG
jgi:DNA-binding MarR family transcriptional regulator